jgi:hypothetical protein|tara:strand:+ start:5430 stop:5921 length:492 start_codon:yes stop_codon:yes gene_type:complete
MEFEFSGKIIEVYYTDPELSSAAVVYREGETAVDYFVTVDIEDPRWLSVLEEVSLEEIDQCTRDRHESHRDLFREAFEDYAERNIMRNTKNNAPRELETYNFISALINWDPEDGTKAEDLFKVKLAIFDHELVKESDNKDVKTAIRRSTTPLEALMEFSKLSK